ncbi:MAG: M20/M25/M40 family metallo-hydrolase [Chitinispirillales bacterium]|jgi:dipeptidase D|nr:M20/M25/M40 family metallo-hydrolase [Chitinispirillales bacterium]
MDMSFNDKILRFFTDVLCPTPRASHCEDVIADRLEEFAAARGLTRFRDSKNNVIIHKPGTGKYAGTSVPVILQAHTDMICVPATADFTGGVEAYYSSENRLTGRSAVTGEKTSLGADDGIGVAAVMAVLDGGEIVHPPLVAIFTAEEECGLTGAQDVSVDDIMGIAPGLDFGRAAFINLDNGHFGQFSVGCAGSANVTVKVPVERMGLPPPQNFFSFELAVRGLSGGHSGLSIHEKRGNANILLCLAVYKLHYASVDMHILGFGRCGDASNAIPSAASVYAAVPAEQENRLREAADEIEFIFKHIYREFDGWVRLEIRESGEARALTEAAIERMLKIPREKWPPYCFHRGDFDDGTPYSVGTVFKLTKLAEEIPNGPIAYSAAMPNLVETSSNLGIIRDEGRHIAMVYMVRSSIDAERERIVEEIARKAESYNSTIEAGSRSPGWAYRDKSALRDLFLNRYKELFGEEAAASPVHAGLECGHFAEKFGDFKDMDFISCGPTTVEIHSVNETLHTETVEKFGRLLIEVLGSL